MRTSKPSAKPRLASIASSTSERTSTRFCTKTTLPDSILSMSRMLLTSRTNLWLFSGALSLLINDAGGKLPAQAKRLLTIAHKNSQRLFRLVNNILDMERIESGKVVFVQKRIEVRSLVEEAIEANRVFAEGFGVRIRLDPASVTGDIRGDPDWLLQVVTNLLSNAVKFSPAAEEVEVAIENRSGNIRISVRDHGS